MPANKKKRRTRKKFHLYVMSNCWEFTTLTGALGKIKEMIRKGHYDARLFCPHNIDSWPAKQKSGRVCGHTER